MKKYVEYMDGITVTADLHERIIERAARPKAPIKIQAFRRYTAPVALAAACVVVLGVSLFAGPQIWGASDRNAPGDPGSSMVFEPEESLKTGGDIPKEEPQPESIDLTLGQALSDADFGAYVSVGIPSQFCFASAQKSTGQAGDSLSVLWENAAGNGAGSIDLRISLSSAADLDSIVHAHEREKYDTALYPFPWDTSVPEDLQSYFKNPVFLSEELTQDTLLARAYHTDDDLLGTQGLRMDFSVLYGDVVVLVNTIGMSPEQLFEMLMELGARQTS